MTENVIKNIEVFQVENLTNMELNQLSEACQLVVAAEDNFGWLTPPTNISAMNKFWQGVMLVPDRQLLIAKLDQVIAGSIQIITNHKNKQARKFNGSLTYAFVAPWARGYKIAASLVQTAESYAKKNGLKILEVEVRESQISANKLFLKNNYVKWGYNPKYVFIDNKWIGGCYYYKEL